MDISDYRILQVIYLTLENTKLERQQMSPFQFRRLIIEALQSRTYTVDVMPGHQRMFVVDSSVILFFPYELENDVSVKSFLLSSLPVLLLEQMIISQNHFDRLKWLHEYHYNFRGYKEIFFVVAIVAIFLILLFLLFRWLTKYFREINLGIDNLLAEDEKKIRLSPEMLPFEYKLNTVKQKLKEQKEATALAEQRKDELVMYLAHDIRTPLTSVIGYLSLLEEEPNKADQEQAKNIHIALDTTTSKITWQNALRLICQIINNRYAVKYISIYQIIVKTH